MKITETNLQNYQKNGFKNLKGILIFGTDEGGVLEHYKTTSEAVNTENDPLAFVDITAEQIKDSPDFIYSEAVSNSFFATQKIIRINTPPTGFEKILDDLLKQAGLSAFFIIRAGNLKAGTKLRAFCEKQKEIVTLACYPDDARSLRTALIQFFEKNALSCSPDAMKYLIQYLGENRSQTRQELEKIHLYLGDEKTISYETVRNVLTDGTTVDASDIPFAITNGTPQILPHYFQKLFQEGVSPIALIRMSLRYFQNLYFMKNWMKTGLSAKASAKKVIPYLFFKIEPIYQHALTKWTQNDFAYALSKLMEAEKLCKTESAMAETLTRMTFLKLALRGKKRNRR